VLLLRPGRKINRRASLLPLRHGPRLEPVLRGQSPEGLFTMFNRSTDHRRRRGAPVVNLATAHPYTREKAMHLQTPGSNSSFLAEPVGRRVASMLCLENFSRFVNVKRCYRLQPMIRVRKAGKPMSKGWASSLTGAGLFIRWLITDLLVASASA